MKRDLLVNFVQVGIDHFGNIENGARWYINSHCNGRKFPIVFAGRLLRDATMQGVGRDYEDVYYGPGDSRNIEGAFSEDKQVFYVEETSPGVINWGYGGYDSSYVGVPEWTFYHTAWPMNDTASWGDDNPYRRCCSANGWVGLALTMRTMSLMEDWNRPAFFDYMDRYTTNELDGFTFSWDPWAGRMWRAHRGPTTTWAH